MTGEMLLFAEQRQSNRAETEIISDEGHLVARVRRGESEAFGQLYEMYGRMVHGILLARVPPTEVDDLMQDVFLRALKNLHSLHLDQAFGGWLAKIARNRAMDFYRREQLTETVSFEDIVTNQTVDSEIEAARVLSLIRGLPGAYRETLILRLVEGMTGPEIAERTGIKPDSVRVNLHRGMKLLRAQLRLSEER